MRLLEGERWFKEPGIAQEVTLIKGCKVIGNVFLRELDVESGMVLDFILRDIQHEHEAGNTLVTTRYNGKNPKRWFIQLYPGILAPIVFGIILGKDELAGWCTLNKSFSKKPWIIFGMMIQAEHRGKGLCSSVLLHLFSRLPEYYPVETPAEIVFNTQKSNKGMQAVASKLELQKIEMIKEDDQGQDDPYVYYLLNRVIFTRATSRLS
nr:GNAT family N-acetyltransferase [Candidatus Sigynarchaeota archaeon]